MMGSFALHRRVMDKEYILSENNTMDVEFEINGKNHWIYEVDDPKVMEIDRLISCRELHECMDMLEDLFKEYGDDTEKCMDIIRKESPDSIVYVYEY